MTPVVPQIIGSRPSSRKSTDKIEDLRAIPWVFSWGQCRQSIPGFYGFGTAVRRFLETDRAKNLRLLVAMYARAYLARKGLEVARGRTQHLLECFNDYLYTEKVRSFRPNNPTTVILDAFARRFSRRSG